MENLRRRISPDDGITVRRLVPNLFQQYRSGASFSALPLDVWYAPVSDTKADIARCRLRARSDILQCERQRHLYCRWNLAAESGEVVKRLDTRNEEIGAALYGCESGQALYLSSDWPFRDRDIVAAVLSADHWIAFVA